MKVAMYYNNRDVRLEEMAVPSIGPGELLVRVKASGICGTDVMEWYRIQKAPLVLGHEIAGEVAAAGAGVTAYRPGDRVMVSHHVPCMQCRYCLSGHHSVCDTLRSTHFDPGGFAEYIRVPKLNVELGTFRLPGEISFEDGSFIEPVGCVARAQRFAGMSAGQSVLVFGSGISGLLHVQLARARGAALIAATDVNDFRLNAARELGADAALNAREDVPGKFRGLNDGRLADLVIVSTGARPAIEQALRSVDRGGTILFFAPTAAGVGVPVPLYELWRDEVRIV
ncbi:MAG TPA: alcohol dehydrogenase catalytic domain-containing protein, partial [Candidatus Binatia bacterium]